MLQKHAPADRIVAFERNFAGRTLALAEITDKAAYREGLPLSGRVLYVPFYDAATDPSGRSRRSTRTSRATRAGSRRMLFELVQGEGGYHTAPPEFFRAVMERCRAAGIAVWVDEVQTFARTGELFAYRTFGLEDLVDVVDLRQGAAGQRRAVPRALQPEAGPRRGHLRGLDGGPRGGRAHHRAARDPRATSARRAGSRC